MTKTKAEIPTVIKSNVSNLLSASSGIYIMYCIEYLNKKWQISIEKSTTANLYSMDLSLTPKQFIF